MYYKKEETVLFPSVSLANSKRRSRVNEKNTLTQTDAGTPKHRTPLGTRRTQLRTCRYRYETDLLQPDTEQ